MLLLIVSRNQSINGQLKCKPVVVDHILLYESIIQDDIVTWLPYLLLLHQGSELSTGVKTTGRFSGHRLTVVERFPTRTQTNTSQTIEVEVK
ncbi:hypothetical protein L6452_44558 [Arctium lappa]|uniref:Uncharacterized protein n=1 Tax=Arctium lappa TaxID=4217 RepID=A0ACB8XFZ2_ARCLA|nr:hypothetical protein L6452_44558 [Arctium lappa]